MSRAAHYTCTLFTLAPSEVLFTLGELYPRQTHGVERGTTSDAFLGGGKKRAVWEFQGKYIIAHQYYLLKMFKMYMQKNMLP